MRYVYYDYGYFFASLISFIIATLLFFSHLRDLISQLYYQQPIGA